MQDMEQDKGFDWGLWGAITLVAAIAGCAVYVALMAQRPTDREIEALGWKQLSADAGHIGERGYVPTYGTVPDRSWPVDHPLIVALIVFVAILFVARLYLFMHRLESR